MGGAGSAALRSHRAAALDERLERANMADKDKNV
jgi:hypothetical protein